MYVRAMTKWLHRYDLPNENGEGWAVIFVTSDGFLSAVTDYGSYGYFWSHHGCSDFRKFLLRPERDPDYLLSKLSERNCWDGHATCQSVKRAIIELRRDGTWTSDEAREEWDLIVDDCDSFYTSEDFGRWLEQTKMSEAWEYGRRVFPPAARAFVTKTLPRLAKLLEDELQREQLAAPVYEAGDGQAAT